MTTKLAAKALTLIRGEHCLFRDLSFALDPGGLLLLEGANGSGKSSLMRVVAGLLSVESGEVEWNGVSIRKQRQEFHSSLAWMGHRPGFKGDLSLRENLRFESALRPQGRQDLDSVFEALTLTTVSRIPLRQLSAGQQRRVALARLVLADVPLWLLDEPFTNLDAAGREQVLSLVQKHLENGGMCVMAAHHEVQIAANVDRIVL